MINKHIEEYGEFTKKLLPSTFLTALLGASISQFVPIITNVLGMVVPAWGLPLAMSAIATGGLWYVNRKNS